MEYCRGQVEEWKDIDVLYFLVKQVFGYLKEQRSGHGAVVDKNACGGDADSVHTGHMGRG